MQLRDSLVRFLEVPESAPYLECGKRTLSLMDVAVGSGASDVEAVKDAKRTLEEQAAYAAQTHGYDSAEHHEAIREIESFRTLWMMVAGHERGVQAHLYAPGGPLSTFRT